MGTSFDMISVYTKKTTASKRHNDITHKFFHLKILPEKIQTLTMKIISF